MPVRSLKLDDLPGLHDIVSRTGVFNPEEIEVAADCLEAALDEESGYIALVAAEEDTDRPLGFVLYGHIACTDCCYDLYWIAVDPDFQGRHLGRELLLLCETGVRELGGRRLYIETSAGERYVPTRGFYLKNGYRVEATMADFYYPGDGKVIFVKDL